MHSEAVLFAALGDPTRLQLLSHLGQGNPSPIRELTSMTSISRQAVTKHLQVLQSAGLVTAQRVGRETRFALKPNGLKPAQAYLETITNQWDMALLRLSAHLDNQTAP